MHSIRRKIVRATLLPALIALGLVMGAFNVRRAQVDLKQSRTDFQDQAIELSDRFDARMREIMEGAEAIASVLGSERDLPSDEELIELMEREVERNFMLSSLSISFESEYAQVRRRAEPFSSTKPILFVHRLPAPLSKTDSGEVRTDFQSFRYDEIPSEWYDLYRRVEQQQRAAWSAPYLDDVGAKLNMLTYGVPVITEEGSHIATVTMDVGSTQLSEYFQSRRRLVLREMADFYRAFVITPTGRYAHSPQPNAFGTDIFEEARSSNLDQLAKGFEQMLADSTGSGFFEVDGWPDSKHSWVAYEDMSGTHFTLLLAADESVVRPNDMFEIVGSTVLVVFLLGMIALIISQSVTRVVNPLYKLSQGAELIGKGMRPETLPVDRQDEIGLVARSMASMMDELAKREEALKEMHRQSFADLVDSLPGKTMYFRTGSDGVINYISPGAEDVLGYPPSAFGEVVPTLTEEVRDISRAELAPLLRGEKDEAIYSLPATHANGRRLHIEILARAVKSDDGEIIGIDGLATDMTDRVAESQKFKAYLDAAPDAFLVVTPTGDITMANEASETVFGYGVDELMSMNVDDLVPDAHRSHHATHRHSYAADPKRRQLDANLDLKARRKDGSEIPVEIALSPVETENGMVIVAAIRDITRRRKAMRVIRENQKFLQQLIDSSPAYIYAKDLEGKYTLANKKFLSTITAHETSEDVVGKSDYDFYPARIANALRKADQQVIESVQQIEVEESVPVLGEVKDFISVKFPLLDADDEVVGICGISTDISEIKAKERAIKESQALLQAIIDNTSAMVYTKDLQGRFTMVNEALVESSGIPHEDWLGKDVFDLLPKEVAQHMADNDRRVMVGGELIEEEERSLHQGRMMHFYSVKFPLWDADGNMSGICGMSTDVTSIKEAEEELLQSQRSLEEEKRLKSIALEAAALSFWSTDLRTHTAYWDENMWDIFGYEADTSPSEAAWKDVLHPEDRDRVEALYDETIATGDEFTVEYRVRRPIDGEIRYIRDSARVDRDEDGEAIKIAGVVHDITQLRTEQEKIRQIFDAPTDGVIFLREGVILEANTALASILGYDSPEELRGLHQRDITPEETPSGRNSWDLMREYSRRAMSGEVVRFKWRHFRKDGTIVPVEKSLFKAMHEGKPALIGTLRDITDLQNAIDRANEANASKSAFLANMSHEIRTPMNAILGFAELLSEQINQPVHMQYLSTIRSSGRALLTLINDILDLSKVEAGKMSLQPRATDLRALFVELEQIFLQKTRGKGIDLRLQIADDLPEAVMLDDVRVRQVMINLIGNAVKFTDDGYIAVSLRSVDDGSDGSSSNIVIGVKDTGLGIPEDEQAKIFEAFEQQSQQSNAKYGGTGLGLAITLKLIHMMGGDIELDSREGEGSLFTIHLPGVPSATRVIEESDRMGDLDPASVVFSSATILVVDDIDVNRELIKGYLEGYSLTILEAGDGQEALDTMERIVPSLVLMDMKMPVMDGYEAMGRIKKNETWSDVVVVALTASTMSNREEDVRGVSDDFLRKPVSRNDLIGTLMRYLPYSLENQEDGKPDTGTDQNKVVSDSRVEDARKGELRSALQDELERVAELAESKTINEVEEFGKSMAQLGESFGHDPLTRWGERLESQAMLFQIDEMIETLNQFGALLEDLS